MGSMMSSAFEARSAADAGEPCGAAKTTALAHRFLAHRFMVRRSLAQFRGGPVLHDAETLPARGRVRTLKAPPAQV